MLHVRHEVALGRLQACLLALGDLQRADPPTLVWGCLQRQTCLMQGGLYTSVRVIACLTNISIHSVTQ